MSSEEIEILGSDEVAHAKEGCLYFQNHKGLIPWKNDDGTTGFYYSDGSGTVENIIKLEPDEITNHKDGTISINAPEKDLVIDKNLIVTEPVIEAVTEKISDV